MPVLDHCGGDILGRAVVAIRQVVAHLCIRRQSEGRAAVRGRPSATVVMGIRTAWACSQDAALLFATQLKVIQSTVPAQLGTDLITAAFVGGVSILSVSAPWLIRRWRRS